jgi:plastocyanin domain-containing protein
MPKMGLRKTLSVGENVIEFIPTSTGTIPFSCGMGMYTGSFTVVDNLNDTTNTTNTGSATNTQCNNTIVQAPQVDRSNIPAEFLPSPTPVSAAQAGSSCAAGGGGCGCGGARKNTVLTDPQLATPTNGEVQVIEATYTASKDVVPNNFTVKAGQPVTLKINAKDDGYGCMGSVMIPGLSRDVYLFKKGQTVTFNVTPPKPGTYQITCGMGIPHGQIVAK